MITIDRPLMGTVFLGQLDGVGAAIDDANRDASIEAVVILGGGASFVAGEDIGESGTVISAISLDKSLAALFLHVENSRKPVVMAVDGAALGAGLDLALAGHYRVASSNAWFGQPEVKLGLIPGAGGTQRLPRLAGVAKAIEICVEGKPFSAQEAASVGLIDRIIAGDLRAGAVFFAREVAKRQPVKTRDRNEKLGLVKEHASIFAAARATATKKQRGLKAPLAAIDAIEASTRLNFEEGCSFEAQLFRECLGSDQSKALIHVLLGERDVAKIPDIPRETPVLSLRRAAVVGSGTMGGGIAMVFANAGIPVLLKDVDQAALDAGMKKICKNYATSVERGRFTEAFVNERLELIKPVLSYVEFSDVDIVVEAIFEGMTLKKKIFADLDRVCRPGAILATNTSTLSIDEIASATSRPEAVIGTHFFSPANVMRLLEVVRGEKSSKEVIATCMRLSRELGKVGVLVGNCRGFVGNRMFGPYRREAQFLVEEGADIEAVDNALVEFGNAMGPLATGDLAGLDVGWSIRKEYRHLEKPGVRQAFAEDRLCELERYGQKTSKGWYGYDENRRATVDGEVLALMRQWSAEAGISQREIASDEIVNRCVYMLVNEGARILEGGYVLRAADIDVIYVNGYGFPPWRGGPMWYADAVGLPKVYEQICEFQKTHGELWEPAPLLKRLAETGKTFAELDKDRSS
ncbi:MAG: 3-hydroxyacyl-CoA dehydrogenase NAD-binding domain-containing protein [Acidobacteriota bacterium]|nr:3-hydroxyacyl-CoA dehydrogenase NAD-binding domain-containing protein [Acidobacteriota bacterium]